MCFFFLFNNWFVMKCSWEKVQHYNQNNLIYTNCPCWWNHNASHGHGRHKQTEPFLSRLWHLFVCNYSSSHHTLSSLSSLLPARVSSYRPQPLWTASSARLSERSGEWISQTCLVKHKIEDRPQKGWVSEPLCLFSKHHQQENLCLCRGDADSVWKRRKGKVGTRYMVGWMDAPWKK